MNYQLPMRLNRRIWLMPVTCTILILVLLASTHRTPTSRAATTFTPGPQLGNQLTDELHTADLNGDGSIDILATQSQSVQIWLNNQDGTFRPAQTLSADGVTSAAVGDLDGDGDLDLVLTTGYNRAGTKIWLNNGQGQFNDSGQVIGKIGDRQYLNVAVGDLDGDSDLDIMLASQPIFDLPTSNEVWLNGEDGLATGVFTDTQQAFGNSAQTYELVLTDVDNDNDLDAVVADRFSSRIWLNDGTGSFSGGQAFNAPWDTDVAAADVDNDQDVDLLFTSFTDKDTLWINQGGLQGGTIGNFDLTSTTVLTNTSTSADFADLDGDGDQDLVFGNYLEANTVWINQGGDQGGTLGQFLDSGERLDLNVANSDVVLADFDADNDIDILFGNNGPDTLYWNGIARVSGADLAVTSSCCSGKGQVLTNSFISAGFTFTITNNGPDPARNVQVTFRGSPEGRFLQSSTGTCSNETGICILESLASGASAQASSSTITFPQTFVGNFTYVGAISESVYVQSEQDDPNPNNNRSTWERVEFFDCSRGCFIETIFCNLSFMRNSSAVRNTATLLQLASDDFVPDLLMYYDLREQVLLGRRDGIRMSELYDTHNQEILSLVLADATLLNSALNTLELWEPNLRALVDGEGADAIVTTAQIEALDTFLNDLSSVAGSELQQAINTERDRLPAFTSVVGQSMADLETTALGPATMYLPMLQNPE